MRLGRPVNERIYSTAYNPIRGKRSYQDNIGPFKSTARILGLGSLLGYDPKGEGAILANQPISRSLDGLRLISEFLNKFNNKPSPQYHISNENGKNYISIGSDLTAKHKFTKSKNYYYLITKKDYHPYSKVKNNDGTKIRIKADNDAEFKEKLGWILCNPTSKAKLDYAIPKLPILNKDNLTLSPSKYIDFNENKVVGDFQLNEFQAIGNPGAAEAFDTEIGGSDLHSINHFVRLKTYQGYSSLKQSTQIQDKFWERVHGMNEHLLSSNIVDELLGNVVNMFHASKNLSPEARAQEIQNIREDFIFDLYRKGSRNSRANQEAAYPYASLPALQNFFSHFLFATDPNRGGRFWHYRNGIIPPALPQVMGLMYQPRGDGGIDSIYDKDPETYLDNLRKLKISIEDRQFSASYGRKILGVYLALKFIKHDLSFIKIDDKNISQKDVKKWKDLTKIHDELFESAGDLKDFLRNSFSGFVQVVDSVKTQNFPNIKETQNIDTNKPITKDVYKEVAKKTLYPLMLNYTQLKNFIGWRTQDSSNLILRNALKKQVFDREVPDIVAGAATVMLLDGLDRISRRLKFIDETIGRDGNLCSTVRQMTDKTMQGDIEGAYTLFTRQIERATNILDYETLFPFSKFHSLQTEGLLWEKEVFRPPTRDYQSENPNFFIGSRLLNNSTEKNGKILTAKLVEAIKMQARLIKDIRQEMQVENIKSPYETKAMFKLSECMRAASKEIALSFMKNHAVYFEHITSDDSEKIIRDILKETYGLQELIGNVASFLATSDKEQYGFDAEKKVRDAKRNKKLAAAAMKMSKTEINNLQGGV